MPKILVAGGGHGGIAAAIHLAKEGYEVLVVEKSEKCNLGLSQTDAIDSDAFEYADIPIPESFMLGKNEVTFIPLEQELGLLTLPQQSMTSVIVDRKELSNYLFSLAEESGVVIQYGESVTSPIILGNRIAGVKTNKGEYYADLVIDACGVNSPVRMGLPNYMGVDRPVKKYDILYSYRAYFNKLADTPPPETTYNLYFKDDGTVGFRWLVTEEDRVDALICRFYKASDSEINETLNDIRKDNPHMGTELIYGGRRGMIPVCQPLALIVANGYAAVGDSAFMTFAVKGSGIAYSLKAGTMLAQTVLEDKNNCFDRESLWEYERRFFKEIGLSAAGIAVCKNLLPYMTAEDVNQMFKSKLFTTDELAELFENKADAILNKKGLATVREKLRTVRDDPRAKELLGYLALWLGKYLILQAQFPSKYDNKAIDDWIRKYNRFFDSIRYTEAKSSAD